MDDNYFNGLIGAEVKVCGVKLANLSLWHLAILEAIGSPILSGESAGIRDMLILLKVTKSKYPKIESLKASFMDGLWIWRIERSDKLALREVNKLREWFAVQMSAPVMYTSESVSLHKGASSPNVLSLVTGIVSRSNETIENVWNMRSAEARWYDVSLAEQDGAELNISYTTEETAPDAPSADEAQEMAKKYLTEDQLASWNRL